MLYSVTAVFSIRTTRGSRDHFSLPANRMVVRLSHATRDTNLSTLHLKERERKKKNTKKGNTLEILGLQQQHYSNSGSEEWDCVIQRCLMRSYDKWRGKKITKNQSFQGTIVIVLMRRQSMTVRKVMPSFIFWAWLQVSGMLDLQLWLTTK